MTWYRPANTYAMLGLPNRSVTAGQIGIVLLVRAKVPWPCPYRPCMLCSVLLVLWWLNPPSIMRLVKLSTLTPLSRSGVLQLEATMQIGMLIRLMTLELSRLTLVALMTMRLKFSVYNSVTELPSAVPAVMRRWWAVTECTHICRECSVPTWTWLLSRVLLAWWWAGLIETMVTRTVGKVVRKCSSSLLAIEDPLVLLALARLSIGAWLLVRR